MRLNWRLICDLSMSLLVPTIKEFWECVNLLCNVMWYCPTLPQTPGKWNSEWLQFIDCKLPGWWQLQNWTCKFVMWKISPHLYHVFLYFVPLPYNFMKSLLGFLSRFFKYSINLLKAWTIYHTAFLSSATQNIPHIKLVLIIKLIFFLRWKWLELYLWFDVSFVDIKVRDLQGNGEDDHNFDSSFFVWIDFLNFKAKLKWGKFFCKGA